jgi:hypothetical protein
MLPFGSHIRLWKFNFGQGYNIKCGAIGNILGTWQTIWKCIGNNDHNTMGNLMWTHWYLDWSFVGTNWKHQNSKNSNHSLLLLPSPYPHSPFTKQKKNSYDVMMSWCSNHCMPWFPTLVSILHESEPHWWNTIWVILMT